MSTAGENQDITTVVAVNKDDNDSDVELEGMDLEGDDGDADDSGDVDVEPTAAGATGAAAQGDSPADNDNSAVTEKLATEDQDELEAAHRERKELMVAEQQKAAAVSENSSGSMEDKLQFLVSQSDVFAHFLAGSRAASEKKRGGSKKKGGSRGKKNRMTEAEEDAQLLQTAESKRSVIRLNKQVRNRTQYYVEFRNAEKLKKESDLAIAFSTIRKPCFCFSNFLIQKAFDSGQSL